MSKDLKQDLVDMYGTELKKFDKEMKEKIEENKRIKEHNGLIRANKAQEGARQAKATEDLASKKDKRFRKSDEKSKLFDDKIKNIKDSGLKTYETLASSLGEIAGLSLAFSKSIRADIWAYLAGPLMDKTLDKLAFGVAFVANELIKEAEEKHIPLDFLERSSSDMVKVVGGALKFEKFEDDEQLINQGIPQDFLHKADIANRATVNFLIRDAGYKYDSMEGVYKKDDVCLDQKNLDNILNSANLKEQVEKAIKDMGLEDEATPESGMRP
ncbi:MAG: hypothetical protein P1U39_01620 [Legionellaceae bacterium]|nr:hypothetical protein [Legionellaceae bacterium]